MSQVASTVLSYYLTYFSTLMSESSCVSELPCIMATMRSTILPFCVEVMVSSENPSTENGSVNLLLLSEIPNYKLSKAALTHYCILMPLLLIGNFYGVVQDVSCVTHLLSQEPSPHSLAHSGSEPGATARVGHHTCDPPRVVRGKECDHIGDAVLWEASPYHFQAE